MNRVEEKSYNIVEVPIPSPLVKWHNRRLALGSHPKI
jgi:hypothetical protein